MKVVINTCWGGFSLSEAAMKEVAKRKGIVLHEVIEKESYGEVSHFETPEGEYYSEYALEGSRNDPDLVAVVEEMGQAANGGNSKLNVVEVPDDVKWYIHDYDGMEDVQEEHRSWG